MYMYMYISSDTRTNSIIAVITWFKDRSCYWKGSLEENNNSRTHYADKFPLEGTSSGRRRALIRVVSRSGSRLTRVGKAGEKKLPVALSRRRETALVPRMEGKSRFGRAQGAEKSWKKVERSIDSSSLLAFDFHCHGAFHSFVNAISNATFRH